MTTDEVAVVLFGRSWAYLNETEAAQVENFQEHWPLLREAAIKEAVAALTFEDLTKIYSSDRPGPLGEAIERALLDASKP